MSKTAEQINTPLTGKVEVIKEPEITITPDDKTVGGYYHNVICPECKAEQRQKLIEEIRKARELCNPTGEITACLFTTPNCNFLSRPCSWWQQFKGVK